MPSFMEGLAGGVRFGLERKDLNKKNEQAYQINLMELKAKADQIKQDMEAKKDNDARLAAEAARLEYQNSVIGPEDPLAKFAPGVAGLHRPEGMEVFKQLMANGRTKTDARLETQRQKQIQLFNTRQNAIEDSKSGLVQIEAKLEGVPSGIITGPFNSLKSRFGLGGKQAYDAANVESLANYGALILAAEANKGRPTDKDYYAVRTMLPSISDPVAKQKDKIAQYKIWLANKEGNLGRERNATLSGQVLNPSVPSPTPGNDNADLIQMWKDAQGVK